MGGGSDTGSGVVDGASGLALMEHFDSNDSWTPTCTRARIWQLLDLEGAQVFYWTCPLSITERILAG